MEGWILISRSTEPATGILAGKRTRLDGRKWLYVIPGDSVDNGDDDDQICLSIQARLQLIAMFCKY